MLRLRPYKACDAKTIISWIKDERSFYQWCADRFEHYPITEDDLNGLYESSACTDDFFGMTAFDESGISGHLFMRFLDEKKQTLRFGFIIIDSAKRGKGYGKEMLQLAIQYAFDILKVDKITLGVFQNNPSAYHCYRSVGFQETGNIRTLHILDEEWECKDLKLTR